MTERTFIARLRRHARNGYQTVPIAKQKTRFRAKLVAVVALFWRRLGDSQINETSAAMAYYAILSLFPTLLVVINVIAHIQFDFSAYSAMIAQLIPSSVLNTIKPIVRDFSVNASTAWLSVGAVVTLWAASLGLAALRNGFNRAYGIRRAVQNFIVSRIFAMVMMIVLLIAVVATMVAFAFGQEFIEWISAQLQLSPRWLEVFLAWRWPVALTVLFVVLVIVDYYLPNARMRFWTVLPGVVITGIGIIAFTQVFSIYVRYFGQRFTTYGTLGAFIVLLLWLFFMSFIMTVGVVVNAVLNETFYGPAEAVGSKVTSAMGRLWRRAKRRVVAPNKKSQ